MLAKKILKKGPGIPIVFLHGFLGRSEDFSKVCSYLPPCQCIGYDLPGHGDSPFIEDFTIDLPEFHLVGYSMGGRIALQKQFPSLTLTLLSTHPGLKTDEEKKARLAADQKWADLLLNIPIDEFLKRWYDQAIFKSFKPDLEARKKQDLKSLARAVMCFSLAHQKRVNLDAVLVGEYDLKFQALFQNPIIIPNASHQVHLENPKAVAEIIKEKIGIK